MMTAMALVIMRRKQRRTHIATTDGPVCGTRTALDHAHLVPLEIAGGATARLKNDLIRELDHNACIPCTRIALGMLALYVSRDNGRPW